MNIFTPITYKLKSLSFLVVAMFFMTLTATAQNPSNGGQISSNQTICQGETPLTLTSTAPASGGNTNLPVEYLWMYATTVGGVPGGSTYTAIPGSNSPNYSPGILNSTTYYIRCARRAGSGILEYTAESNVITVTVLPFPTAIINGNPIFGYTGLSVNYTANYGGPGATYSWNFGNGLTSSGLTPSKVVYNSPGTYTVSLTVTSAAGCDITTTTTISVNSPFGANINDPCNNCGDPLNIADFPNLAYYNHDYIYINSNSGETWTIVNISGVGGGIFNQSLSPISVGTFIPETSPGVYYSNVWFNGALGGWQVTLMSSSGKSLTTGPGSISPCPPCPNAPLPVELVSFDANVVNSTIVLKWATASESNSSHFELERSTDGGDRFDVISEIASLGNSSNLQTYVFTDEDPAVGDNYYRLKQVDLNGEFEYFNAIVARIESDNIGLQVVPNPVKDIATIKIGTDISQNAELQLLTSFGELVKTISITNIGGNEFINLKGLPSGVYILALKNRSNIFHKIIKL